MRRRSFLLALSGDLRRSDMQFLLQRIGFCPRGLLDDWGDGASDYDAEQRGVGATRFRNWAADTVSSNDTLAPPNFEIS